MKACWKASLWVWHYVSMMDSNIQWKVGAWPWGLNQESVSGMTISLPGQ